MARDRTPRVGAPFNAPVTHEQQNRQYTAGANFESLTVAPPLTKQYTPGGGMRLGIQLPTVLTQPSTTARFGYIIRVTSTPMVLVKFLKHKISTVDGRTTGEWSTDGDARAAWLFPNAQGSDVATLARGDFDSTTPVVRLDRIGGVWYVTWVPRWTIRDLPSTAGRVRCP